MPARSTAAFIAAAPNWLADSEDKLPPKLPIGVLAAETITTSFIGKHLDLMTAI
jgi:hypothetical protein